MTAPDPSTVASRGAAGQAPTGRGAGAGDPAPGPLRREARRALRHGRLALRRSRRRDQHHAPHPPGLRRRGDPPRAQPVGPRDRRSGDRGGRPGRSPSRPTRAGTWSSSSTRRTSSTSTGATHVKIFGGGGGVIVPEEIEALHAYGIDRIFSPEDGRKLGLQGMIDAMMQQADFAPPAEVAARLGAFPDVDRERAPAPRVAPHA